VKVGDLVKIKFATDASARRAMMSKEPTNEPGIVIEVEEGACKVMFPSIKGKIRSFLKSSLEVISESR